MPERPIRHDSGVPMVNLDLEEYDMKIMNVRYPQQYYIDSRSYRVVECDGYFYPQYHKTFLWGCFSCWVSYKNFVTGEFKVHFQTLKEAYRHIFLRENLLKIKSNKKRTKLKRRYH